MYWLPKEDEKSKKEDCSPGQPEQVVRSYLQNTRAQRAGGMAQAAEHVFSKY
jgi:hypothetical protein